MKKNKAIKTAAKAVIIAVIIATVWAGLAAQFNKDVPDFLRGEEAAITELIAAIVGLATLIWCNNPSSR